MSKKSNLSFRELPPPQFIKVFTIAQPEKQLISEHWKNLISSIELQIISGSKSMCLVYKSNSYISLMCFQESCLVYQRKFKILYAQVQQITCIKLHSIIIKHKQLKKRQAIVAIGFFDGAIELYHLNINDKAVILKKYLAFDSEKKQAVTNIVIVKGNMYVSRLHQVQLYEDSFCSLADLIIQQEFIRQTKPGPLQIKCQVKNISLRNMGQGMSLSVVGGKNSLHIFNQSQGARTFLLDKLDQYGSITDSIFCLTQILDENIVIGDTNDKLKIIYKKRNLIERYSGFKNYCSDICHMVFQDYQELWIVDLHGCISYMQRTFSKQGINQTIGAMKMIDYQIHFATKICEAGIKKAIVNGKMLIVLDTQGNIHIFDIIKKDMKKDRGDVQIEQINQFSSENNN